MPRLEAWNKTAVGRLPPLAVMVAHYIGYEVAAKDESPALTQEEHAAKLLNAFGKTF